MSFSGKKISKNKRESVGGKDFIFDRVTFSSDDGKFRTQFLFDYKMFMKKQIGKHCSGLGAILLILCIAIR